MVFDKVFDISKEVTIKVQYVQLYLVSQILHSCKVLDCGRLE